MACAVSCWVCIASIVKTAPARSANAFSSSRTAGISLRFLVHGDLPEDRADAVRQGRDQVRGLPGLALRAADGLAVDGDDQPAPARTALVHSQAPRTRSRTSGLTRAKARRNVDSSAGAADRAQHREHLRAGIGGPLPDRGERLRAGDDRRDPDGEQPGQRVPAAALLPRVRDLGKEIEQVLAAGSRDRRRWHRRAGVPRGRRW